MADESRWQGDAPHWRRDEEGSRSSYDDRSRGRGMGAASWGGRYSEGGYGRRERGWRSDDDYGPEGYGVEDYGRSGEGRGDAPEGYQGYGRQGYGREGGPAEDRRRSVGRSGYGGYEGGRYARGGSGREDWGASARHAGGYYGSGAYDRDERDRAFRGGYGDFDRGDAGRYDDYKHRGYARYGRDDERGLWDRTRDEVASWFGDDEAEQRRRMDEMRSGRHRGRGPRGYTRSDERIREDVNDRLTDDPFVDASGIEVRVAACEVTLEGSVEHRADKRRAEDIAEQVSGVAHVQNNLRVRPFGGAVELTGMGGKADTVVGGSDGAASTASGSSSSTAGAAGGASSTGSTVTSTGR